MHPDQESNCFSLSKKLLESLRFETPHGKQADSKNGRYVAFYPYTNLHNALEARRKVFGNENGFWWFHLGTIKSLISFRHRAWRFCRTTLYTLVPFGFDVREEGEEKGEWLSWVA